MVRPDTMNLSCACLTKYASRDRTPWPLAGPPGEGRSGFDVVLPNPSFSRHLDPDRVVEDFKIGRTRQTELLFLQPILRLPFTRTALRRNLHPRYQV